MRAARRKGHRAVLRRHKGRCKKNQKQAKKNGQEKTLKVLPGVKYIDSCIYSKDEASKIKVLTRDTEQSVTNEAGG